MMNHDYFTYDKQVSLLRGYLSKLKDNRQSNSTISLLNCLMGGFTMFSLKDPSLLHFVREFPSRKANMKSVYGIDKCPSDTAMRAILDPIAPSDLQSINTLFIKDLADKKVLNNYLFLDKYLLVANDGTSYFSSKKVHCPHCLTKQHRNGTTTYHHQCLSAAIVHPDRKEVFVLRSEDIFKEDGATKNDCELNAAKRLIPHLASPIEGCRLLFLEDALYGNGPHLDMLLKAGHSFIINIKKGSQGTLFNQFERLGKAGKTKTKVKQKNGLTYQYEYVNGLFLNGEHPDILVNVVHFQEIDNSTGVVLRQWYFMTDIDLNTRTVDKVVRAGRARWKIENETFNTLKNQGYNYEHNYGHGKQNLATNLSLLMFLAFLIDQIIQHCDCAFRSAWTTKKSKKALWEKVRQLFDLVEVPDMNTIYLIIAKKIKLKTTLLY